MQTVVYVGVESEGGLAGFVQQLVLPPLKVRAMLQGAEQTWVQLGTLAARPEVGDGAEGAQDLAHAGIKESGEGKEEEGGGEAIPSTEAAALAGNQAKGYHSRKGKETMEQEVAVPSEQQGPVSAALVRSATEGGQSQTGGEKKGGGEQGGDPKVRQAGGLGERKRGSAEDEGDGPLQKRANTGGEQTANEDNLWGIGVPTVNSRGYWELLVRKRSDFVLRTPEIPMTGPCALPQNPAQAPLSVWEARLQPSPPPSGLSAEAAPSQPSPSQAVGAALPAPPSGPPADPLQPPPTLPEAQPQLAPPSPVVLQALPQPHLPPVGPVAGPSEPPLHKDEPGPSTSQGGAAHAKMRALSWAWDARLVIELKFRMLPEDLVTAFNRIEHKSHALAVKVVGQAFGYAV